ncbi:Peptide methionine sulfoxide reductase B5, variant 2 [Taiwanofungus camphoratus]|nr:Peptide methionine sulfoxide reductase B5, variant 2 [Antrodia cinnamomea]
MNLLSSVGVATTSIKPITRCTKRITTLGFRTVAGNAQHRSAKPRYLHLSHPRAMNDPKTKSDSEWKAVLSPEQFRILRQKGTEPAGTGKYEHFKSQGVYSCAGCSTPLYKSTTKFDSGCGWPAFFDGKCPYAFTIYTILPPLLEWSIFLTSVHLVLAIPGAVNRHEDRSFGMTRTEITCAACGGHLGHIFKGEGFKVPTDERHCVNSISLNFVEDQDKA